MITFEGGTRLRCCPGEVQGRGGIDVTAFASLGLLGPGPGLAPAAAAEPTLGVLTGLLVLLVGAKLGEEVARRLGQPAVVGELFGGFVVGPHALALVTPGETANLFAEVGVVILLFAVGLEVRLDDLLAVG
ncbi:MAG: hypothetical protein C4342_08465, partial [Armatimonadota bacterium]